MYRMKSAENICYSKNLINILNGNRDLNLLLQLRQARVKPKSYALILAMNCYLTINDKRAHQIQVTAQAVYFSMEMLDIK